ncbi:S-adenosyl-L-methionine-dependentmethyltransferases superfamily protein [Striga asiatica]|uniref:S-adenosyl-L-methionine-dependentmethyltransferases superfamily protein n=1 Tax=Striga asiatica TaxID=4170 RepID=A0A5A7R6E1_STRAF|nr:S-adenosyl-L-methionine-dependentmethyltransferases superfamily protein [Striga asiatica]
MLTTRLFQPSLIIERRNRVTDIAAGRKFTRAPTLPQQQSDKAPAASTKQRPQSSADRSGVHCTSAKIDRKSGPLAFPAAAFHRAPPEAATARRPSRRARRSETNLSGLVAF